ncbi:glycosyltransferase family 2 protein [Thalassobellus sediminis]|uniref:glycosyltransferase family 2 protein n=1 Tax=Thalassobellus sediminis TaxID=3367753 RepID=UPI0037AE73E0
MKNTPLISVVLPVYNVAPYIKEAIDSVLNQTIQDFEILVIDDCSTDNTLEVIESIKDSRIRIIKKSKNKGLIDSLNMGFSEANGDYIARMDGDDINALNRFEKQLHILQNNPEIKACGCWLEEFGIKEDIIKHKEFHSDIVNQMLISCPMSMGAVMFDKKSVREFRFDETKLHVEDYDFWSRVAWAFNLYNLQEVLYYYRVHETQVSSKYKQVQLKGDIPIKLFLFKKLNYDVDVFTDKIITKVLLQSHYITLNEFSLFNKWMKKLLELNCKSQIYSQDGLELALKIIKEKLYYSLYFSKSSIGITKEWRFKSLFKLDLKDAIWVLNKKGREIKKIFKYE